MMATLEAPTRPQIRLHEGPFVNEPLTNFGKEENARKMRAALEKVRGQLGREYDLIIGGKRVRTKDKIKSINPAKPSQVVGLHQKAGKEHVEPAMQAALEAFESWSQASVEERSALLFRAGDLLRERKFEFCAWLVFEVSKNWAEADADIAETIDFCEYYSREALRLSRTELPVQMPCERDSLLYIQLGLGAVIRSLKWGVKMPSSWTPMLMLTRPLKVWPRRLSDSRARSARPVPALLSTSGSTTNSWRN